MDLTLSKDGTKEIPAWYATRAKTGPKEAMDPIKDILVIRRIIRNLRTNARDHALFVVGIYTASRIGDILSMNVRHAKDAQRSQELVIREQKTKNRRRVTLSKKAAAALRYLVAVRLAEGADLDDPLFVTEQKKKRVTVAWAGQLVKKWCKDVGLSGTYGAHTLRKTFGYQQRVTNGVSLEKLQAIYGHSSGKITLTYVAVQDEELKQVYLKEF